MRKKFGRFILAAWMVSASALLGFNCSQFAVDSTGTMHAANLASTSTETAEPQLPVALLSSEQILKAMVSAAGVEGISDSTLMDDQINRTFAERSGSLPSSQSLKMVTGPMLISVANLASSVCDKAVSRDVAVSEAQRGDRLFFREMDFSQGLSGQSSESVVFAFERLARNAWRRDVSPDEITKIVQFAQEFSAGQVTTDPAQTRLLAVSICTAVLSSIDLLTY